MDPRVCVGVCGALPWVRSRSPSGCRPGSPPVPAPVQPLSGLAMVCISVLVDLSVPVVPVHGSHHEQWQSTPRRALSLVYQTCVLVAGYEGRF